MYVEMQKNIIFKIQFQKNEWLAESRFFAPVICFGDLLLFGWSEVILGIESLPDLLRSFALDHVGNGFARYIEKPLDVQLPSIWRPKLFQIEFLGPL